MLQTLLLVFIICSWLFWLVALYLVHSFFQPTTKPRAPGFTPPVSILKPIKGVDVQAYENFASFCRQDYPHFEVIFGVADRADPVVPIVERLKRENPSCPIRLLVIEPFGANRKASLLHGLAAAAHHEVLVASDSDMRVTPDYLRRIVAPLADERVGLVTCPYQGDLALNFTARLEALHMGATFLPMMLAGRGFLDMRFAMGATAALRRSDLERIGDLAVNIAERAIFLATQEKINTGLDFSVMVEKTRAMLKKSIDALVTMDAELANTVLAADDDVDEINRQMYELVEKGMQESPAKVKYLLHLISVSRNLERIADHATNIAEDVIYLCTAQIVRHGKRE